MPERSSRRKASKKEDISSNAQEEKSLLRRLRVCKSELEKIAYSLRPEGSLEDIEEQRIREFLAKLDSALVEIKNAPDETQFLKPKEGVYEYLVEAKFQLLGSLKALSVTEEKYRREVYVDHLHGLRECHKNLNAAIKRFLV